MNEPADSVRLQKFLSNAGVASRRKAEELIREGRVTVNGSAVTELGTRVDPEHDRVAVDERAIQPAKSVWIAVHKPAGYLTSRGDPHGRPTIYDLLPVAHRGLFYVGRLDYETEGLVLLTNNGDLAHRLQHPRYHVPRVYELVVYDDLPPAAIERLLQGVQLEDGPAHFLDVRVLKRSARETSLRVTLAEGRKREVRRMLAALGYTVRRLQRIRYGPITLGSLAAGKWRSLTAEEIRALDL
jgi:23S rRNA pseudouridine2605 synthase